MVMAAAELGMYVYVEAGQIADAMAEYERMVSDTIERGIPNAVRAAGFEALDYARRVTHVRTGFLQLSHYLEWFGGTEARIFPYPGVVNPYGERPAVYGLVEHNRGGSHAFYQRVADEDLRAIANVATQQLDRGMVMAVPG